MLKNLFQNKLKFFGILLSICCFLLIRLYENELFYDPFLVYFKSNYMSLPLPKLNIEQFIFGIIFRYFLNSILSIAIIQLVFNDLKISKFGALLYLILFILMMTLLFFILNSEIPNKMVLFYVRRFLIQPLFLLLFLPAFYIQNKSLK